MASAARSTTRGEPLSFLKSFRRRGLFLWILYPGCLAAAALNEAVRWSTVGVNRWRGLDLPVLDVGPLFVLIAMIAAARRWRPDYTAAQADRHLAFQDRFASLLDFAGRRDISPPVRAAQGEEVRTALAGRSPREALPLRPLLFAGPLLLFFSLAYPLFLPSSPVGLVTLLRRMDGPPLERNLRSNGQLDEPGNAPRPVQTSKGPDTPAGDRGNTRPNPASPQEPTAANRIREDFSEKKGATPRGDAARRRAGLLEGPLVSERVGRQLSRVVNPLFQESAPRAAAPEQPAGGTIAFRLLPKSGKTGSGDGTGGGENPEAASLNLDAVPEAYRQLVKTYFTLLGGDAGQGLPAGDGKPPGAERKD